ncbi:MAG: amino acid adenylation domain-containing protein [Candidatus Ozemobacteraceae bacterium]
MTSEQNPTAGCEFERSYNISDSSQLVIYLNPNSRDSQDVTELAIQYQTAWFGTRDIEKMYERLTALLADVVQDPTRTLAEFAVMSPAEQRQILVEFNATQADYPKDKTIVDLFEAQAAKSPEHTALVWREQSMTYRELNEKANQLAGRLRQYGVKPDDMVGILANRCLEMLVGTLAVIKAGGAYLPIDSAYPDERVRYMLEDSQAKVLLSQKSLTDKVGDFAGIRLDINDSSLYQGSGDNLPAVAVPENLVYMIYTSGSTGKPKGVMIEHRALVNLCTWQNRYHGITAADSTAFYSGFGFDASVWEIFPFLTSGATVHIIGDELRLSALALNEYFEQHKITIADLPTQFAEQFMELTENTSLRRLVTGGDRLKQCSLGRYVLVNEYGPTEYTISATAHTVEKVSRNIPIGKPLANTQIYVLDKLQRPLPVGVPGEMCIAGAGLARGYWNKPDLTRDKFVPNPFIPGERMYRTGDVVRWLPDGNIEFVGRLDFQIKIRGYRIEPGEIEQRLIEHENVRQAAVLDLDDGVGGKYLCAYIVPMGKLVQGEIREFLADRLPDYMIPTCFMTLDQFPLTTNGKLDRNALPVPVIENLQLQGHVAPRNATEKTLVSIWQDILALQEVGIDDNFFKIGGHSLKAGTMQAKIQKSLNVRVPLADIFKYPTIRLLAEYISGERNEAGEQEKAGKTEEAGVAGRTGKGIPVVPEREYYPLSMGQQRIFTVHQMETTGTTYNIPMSCILTGVIDVERLESALNQLVDRHEMLHTTFEVVDGKPVQKILPAGAWDRLFLEKLQVEKVHAEEAETLHHIIRNFVRPFDLGRAPLIRAGMAELAPDRRLLVLDVHHIVFDGTSLPIFMEELSVLYAGGTLSPLPITYHDYAVWQETEASSDILARQEKYWLETFAGEIPVLNLPTDYQRPVIQSFSGKRMYFNAEKKLLEEIEALAASQGATLYMVLLAVFQTLLARYSGQEDIIVGSPAAGRTHSDLERVVGMFVNTLAVRCQPAMDKTFADFLAEVKIQALATMENQDYQFNTLVGKLGLKRDVSRNPLFDVMFVLQNTGTIELAFSGVTIRTIPFETGVAQFDLTLEMEAEENGLLGVIEYSDRLFSAQTVQNMIQHFLNLLRAVVREPQLQLGRIPMLSVEEKQLVLSGFNATFLQTPEEVTVHGMFEKMVNRYPENVALVWQDTRLSYRELNEKTNRLARTLRRQGVGPDKVVAILVNRNPNIILGSLAVMKAGGAYLPIDPAYPEERIAYMLADSGAVAVLTEAGLRPKIGEYQGLCIDFAEEDRFDAGTDNLESLSGIENLVYVIYTSGSTGKPKGVMIEHGNLINLCVWHHHYHQVTSADAGATYSGFGFDASIWEMYPFLTAGACLHIIPEEIRLSPEAVNNYLEANQITIINLPTQFCEQFMEQTENKSLKTLVTGGDKLKAFRPRNYRLVNEYGPTEYTISATVFGVVKLYDNIPIGKPLANTWAYILDKCGNPQPVGVPGELCIAGAQLARGYLNRPELTGEKFVVNPFRTGTKNAKMYKTGDLVRWLPDGNIEFLGRIDQQVKIRGYRIELGEIEQRLHEHPMVRDAVVIDHKDAGGSSYLCAYFVLSQPVSSAELSSFLSKELPEYMVPACFMELAAIPLTPNGKVDRRMLPVPNVTAAQEKSIYVAAETAVEKCLVSAWQEVLGIEKIGIDDPFFALGGDSIKAIQVIGRLGKHQLKLEMKHIFQHPTIRELSKYVVNVVREADNRPIAGEVILTPIQRWFFAADFSEMRHWNQSLLLLRQDSIEITALREALTAVATHHDALRLTYRFAGGQVSQFNRGATGDGPLFGLRIAEETATMGSDLQKWLAAEANVLQQSMDLTAGPLLHAAVCKTKQGDYLILVAHHLVIDGVSWRIVQEDLITAYHQACRHEKIQLPVKTDSYQRWAGRLQEYAVSRGLLAQSHYWQGIEQLQAPALPVDRVVAGRKKLRDNKVVEITFTPEETNQLLKTAHFPYRTEVNDLLLAGLGLAINGWTGKDKVLVVLEGHGREEILPDVDISRTVGWFTSTFPVMLAVEQKDDLGHVIKTVKENLRRIPDHGMGSDILRHLTPAGKRGFDYRQTPEIEFNYLGEMDNLGQNDGGKNNGGFSLVNVGVGDDVSQASEMDFKLLIGGLVMAGCLKISIGYSALEYDERTMEGLLKLFQKHLRRLLAHCKNCLPELSPSDLGDSNLSLTELATIQAVCGKDIAAIYPLTPMQEGMLFLARRQSDSSAYFEQEVLEIKGDIDLALFEKNLNEVITRHDILRTAFVFENIDRVRQVVLRERPIKLYFEDISDRSGAEQTAYVEKVQLEQRNKGFDLTHDPLLRCILLKLATGRYNLLYNFPHIILDGWSMAKFTSELFGGYLLMRKHQPALFAKSPPFRNYVEWLEKQDKEVALQAWRDYLANLEQQTSLPMRKATLIHIPYQPGDVMWTFDAETSTRLNDLAREHKVTLNIVMQAIWGILLQRCNNTNDVVFGSVVSGRPPEISEVEQILGLFINTVPVRVTTAKETSFADLLATLQAAALAMEPYSFCPLAEIQTCSPLKDGLISNLVAFENIPTGDSAVDEEFSVESVGGFDQISYDFGLVIVPFKEILVRFSYNAAAFEPLMVENMAGHFRQIVAQIVQNPGIAVSGIDILSPRERQEVLVDFNRTALPYPLGQTVHGLFESMAAQYPHKAAVVWRNTVLTYSELNEKANRLARSLRRLGVKTDSIVAILVERNPDIIIGSLAVMKAGGAYLPIDPGYPEERIAYMLEDSGALAVLTEASPGSKLSGYKGLYIDLAEERWFDNSSDNLEPASGFGDLAYIIYTSGSTGKPKGVMIEHGNLLNLCSWHQHYHQVTSADSGATYSGFGFDASIWEMYPFLTVGACLHIIPDEIRLSAKAVNEYLEANGITIINLPTQFCEQFMELTENKSLKTLVTGGDKLKFFKPRGYRLVNEYGPTEYTISTTAFCVDKAYDNIPIGKPLANTWTYILGRNGNPQPVGVPGELCIAGAQLSRGYLNRPDLTAEKFVDNPFRTEKLNAKMYKTGDLVRWLPDGNIEFLGRIDQQVKIRGYRIELGEIEQALLGFEGVRDAVVIDRQDAGGGSYLCAYLVSDQSLSIPAIKEFLRKALPEYMSPSSIIQVAEISLNANGKVDRKALPEPVGGEEYVAPRSEIEQALARIWQDILGTPRIGVQDDFFKLGGHSLRVGLLAAKIEQGFNVKLTFSELFELRTLSEQSHAISLKQETAERFISIAPAPDQEYYPLSPAQHRMFVMDQMEGIGSSYHITTALWIDGPMDKQKFRLAIDEMVSRHEALRTSFMLIEDQVVQQVHSRVKYKRVLRELDESSGEEEIKMLVQAFVKKFDLSRAPLFRVELVKTSKNRHLLLFDIHHIVFDGVSMEIFWSELFAIYNGSKLTPPPLQYRDAAVWQNLRLKSDALLPQERYWLNVFEGELPVLNLPLDHPRPATRSYEGEMVEMSFDTGLTTTLRQLAEQTHTTLFAVCLSAYFVLLGKYADQEDVVVGVPSAGRYHADLEKVMGMFASTLPLRAYPAGGKTFRDLVSEVAGHVMAAVDNQEYPLDRLVEKLGLPRNPSRNPLFDVMFSFTTHEPMPGVNGLTITPWDSSDRSAQFDLSLEIIDQAETLSVIFEFCTALFDAETIKRMAGHYRQIMLEVTGNPDTKLADESLLTRAEQEQLLVDFNRTELVCPREKTIQELFAEQVAVRPDKQALVFRDQRWTYGELDRRTNTLAATLRGKGVCPDNLVAIMVERSADIIIGSLAILKSGGAYLPIDPEYPPDRIIYMLKDSGAKLLLSQKALREKALDFDGEWLDMADENLYRQSDKALEPVNKSSDMAYVIYTSGSTGKPKGVMIEHRNLVNLCAWLHSYHKVSSADNAASYSGFGFDASIWEMYPFLTIGATLHIIPEELRLSPMELNAYFENQAITITNLPTQFCEQFMKLTANTSLKTLVTGGDKLKTYQLQKFRLVNEYGPTECTISATAFIVDRQYANIPIGKPLANTWAYVVNRHGKLQPIGVAGELWLAGAQTARGYLNQPGLTSEKFMLNPFSTGEADRQMFKTGDLVRWLPDGNIEYLGRVDQQVKIRGYRIEPGEIEQQMLEYPGVHGAVVVDLPDANNEKYLAAYFSMVNSQEQLDENLLKTHLSRVLPDYMIPTVFIQLPEIPLTANGKVNRRALPVPVAMDHRARNFVPPSTPVEQSIAKVWQEVLGLSEIGVHDNFFSLGGNSLKVVSVVAKLQKNFEVSVNQLFEYQTITALASRLSIKSNNLKNKLAELKEQAREFDEAAAEADTESVPSEMVGAEQQAKYRCAIEKYQHLDLAAVRPYQNILLTGATGYLGVHLAGELLATTNCHIYLLVRGSDSQQAVARVQTKTGYYFGEQTWTKWGMDKRVTVINGSLEQEKLGLSPEVYEKLVTTVDVIIHAAANVKHYGHYNEFWQSNVQGTNVLLQFAQTGKRKDFNYISTVSIASGVVAAQKQVLFTEEDADVGQELENYYLKTKLEAEKAVIAARSSINANIFRVGNIVFHSVTGVYQDNIEDNAFFSLLKSFINLGVVPTIMDDAEFSYVDRVARSIVLLFNRQALSSETYHIYNSQTIKLSEALTDASLGLSVKAVNFAGFIDYLYQHYDQLGCKEYISNAMLHFGWMDEESKEQGATEFTVLAEKTNSILARLGFCWDELQPAQMKGIIYRALRDRIEFLRGVSFLAGLSRAETEQLAGIAIQKNYDDEQDILWEDETNDQVHLIMNGFAEVSRASVGGWQGTLSVAGPGSIVGEENILATGPSPVTVEAVMGETVTLAFPGEALRALIRKNPQLAMSLLQAMNDKIRRLEKVLVSMG